MANWSNLPRDAVEAVSKLLENGADYVRFRSVCSSWRSWAPMKPQFPWLLVKCVGDDENVTFGLYNFPNPRLLRPPHLPDAITQGKKICGCSRGWICLLDSAQSISLHNPFTGTQIQLPPFTDFHVGHRISEVGGDFMLQYEMQKLRHEGARVSKIILSSDPAVAPNDCVVMGMWHFGRRLIFLLPGANSWTISPSLSRHLLEDIIYYKGRFYAVSNRRLFVCDPRNNADVTEIPSAYPPRNEGRVSPFEKISTRFHLVESSGEILLVTSTTTEHHNHTSYQCEVYQVDLSGGLLKLLKLNNLGGRSLFLGFESMSVSAGNFPGCQTNCIYTIEFSSSNYKLISSKRYSSVGTRFKDNIAIFNMEDGSTRFISNLSDDTPDYRLFAYWLTSSLCD